VLLILFALLMLGLWMLPVLLMGYPYVLSDILLTGKTLAETGRLENTVLRLPAVFIWALHPLISWDNVVGWTAVSATYFALALLPWWWSVKQLFNERVAWLSTVVLALLPLYWVEALDLGGYTLALLFLFLSFTAFIKFHELHHTVAIILSGICFGLTLASQHAFLTFLPWFVVAYLWYFRKQFLKAVILTGVFCTVAYIAYALPLLPNALLPNMTPQERLAVFLPFSGGDDVIGEGHLYPDEFIFTHYRKEYDETIQERVAGESFFSRQEDLHYRLISVWGILD
jgi:hypothetical protein